MVPLTDIVEVIKASPAIQVESKMTLLQRRAWNVLLANAYNELPIKEIHRVNVMELSNKLGFNFKGANREYLKEALRSLVDCTVEWNILGKDKSEEWGVASLLASAKIKDGICTYSFAPELRYKFYDPRIYTKLNLHLKNSYTKTHTLGIAMYDIIKPALATLAWQCPMRYCWNSAGSPTLYACSEKKI